MPARPRSIVLFDWFSLSARIISTLPSGYEHLFGYLNRKTDPELDAVGLAIYYVLIFSPVVPPLLLWFFISRKASNMAKWLLSAFVAYEAVAVILNQLSPTPVFTGFELVLLGVVAFDVVAIVMLYRPDARKWFKRRGRFGGIDPETFD
jgi:hypothetical protein